MGRDGEGAAVASSGIVLWDEWWIDRKGVHEVGVLRDSIALAFPVGWCCDLEKVV